MPDSRTAPDAPPSIHLQRLNDWIEGMRAAGIIMPAGGSFELVVRVHRGRVEKLENVLLKHALKEITTAEES